MPVAEQLAQQAHDIAPDLLVISGDLVLRADITSQWTVITALLNMLPQPQLVVPGNHDVSLFNGFYRLFFPLKRYRHYISDNINPVFQRPGLLVAGGCSAHGLTIDGGFLYPAQLRSLDETFSQSDADTCKVLVVHHPVVNPPKSHSSHVMTNAKDALRLIEKHDVDLFLCGHVHTSYVGRINEAKPKLSLSTVISQCGTTTSRRGRGTDKRKNSFHLITIDTQHIHITPYFYQPNEKQFLPLREYVFPRHTQQTNIGDL